MNGDCGCDKAQGSAGTVQSAGGPQAPSLEPPGGSINTTGGGSMSDTIPTQDPPSMGVTVTAGADTAPSLLPSAAASGTDGGITAWLGDKRVSALWGINQNRNSWVHIAGIGWKKLANNSDSAVVALTILGAHAKQSQTNYSYREEADGMIHETYVW